MFHAFVEQSEKMIILSGKYIAKGFITIIHHDTLSEANFIIIFHLNMSLVLLHSFLNI